MDYEGDFAANTSPRLVLAGLYGAGGVLSAQSPAPSGANKKSFPRGALMHHLAPRQLELSNGHLTALA